MYRTEDGLQSYGGQQVLMEDLLESNQSYNQLNQTIMVSKKAWLAEALERNIEVLIYNGNLDVIVNVPGTNR